MARRAAALVREAHASRHARLKQIGQPCRGVCATTHGLSDTTRWLLAAGDGGSAITIRDLADRSLRSIFHGAALDVTALAFSPDGTLLASGSRGQLRLWDVTTGQPVLDLVAGDGITGVAFSRDGRRPAAGTWPIWGEAPRATVFDLDHGRGLQTLRGLSSRTTHLCFSPDVRYLAALAHNWQIGLWELEPGQLRHALEAPIGFSADNVGLAFDHRGERFAIVCGTEARMWNVASGALVNRWSLPPGFVDQLAFAPAGQLLEGRVETRDGVTSPFGSSRTAHPPVARLGELRPDGTRRTLLEDTNLSLEACGGVMPPNGASYAVEGRSFGQPRDSSTIVVLDAVELRVKKLGPFDKPWRYSTLITDSGGELLGLCPNEEQSVGVWAVSSGTWQDTWPVRVEALSARAQWGAVRGIPGQGNRGCSVFRPSSEAPVLTLGIDHVLSYYPVFDHGGTRLAWGSGEGLVFVGDLTEIRHRLAGIGLGW